MDPTHEFTLYIVLLIILLMFILTSQDTKQPTQILYPLTQVPYLNDLNDTLQQRHKFLQRIAEHYIKIKSKSDTPYMCADEWCLGVNTRSTHRNKPNWYFYDIIQNNEFLPHITDENIKQLFTPYLPFINNLGFLWVLPCGSIHTCVDSTGFEDGCLKYHYNLHGDDSIMILDSKYIKQSSGDYILYDATVPHSIKNGPNNYMAIYADMKCF